MDWHNFCVVYFSFERVIIMNNKGVNMNGYDEWLIGDEDCYDTYEREDVENFYYDNQDLLEDEWEEYVVEHDWGSGEDKIKITDEIFWDFIEGRFQEGWKYE